MDKINSYQHNKGSNSKRGGPSGGQNRLDGRGQRIGGGGPGSQTGGPGGRHNVIQLPQHDVQLRTTDNAYKPVKMVNAQLDDAEKVLRGVRAILNKLTPQNFQKFVGELVNLEINADDNRLRGTVDIIFENSIKEPKLSAIYANLCKALNMVNNTLFSLKTLIT
jgi:translation initiation factor 4G